MVSWETVLLLMIIAFIAEYIDSTVGMGYGTTLTPILMLLFGFAPLQIVPAVLLSELITGITAAAIHHRVGNVSLMPRSLNPGFIFNRVKEHGIRESVRTGVPIHLKIALVIISCSILGTLVSVYAALNLPKLYVKLYIGVLIFVLGVFVLVTSNRKFPFSWKKIVSLGILASFNKGISGGGYGPLVTGGQLLSGVEERSTVGITSFSEGITCFIGITAYFIAGEIDLSLAPYLVVGAVASAPLSAYTVKIIPIRHLRLIIGIVTIILGASTLLQIFLSN
ncbi:MAG: hypothetical protein DRP87_08060 [Spirochaetes bacterium]|nr:MAG: hypothetical protein DRP87_08060 [Spirochaetota bacterium]